MALILGRGEVVLWEGRAAQSIRRGIVTFSFFSVAGLGVPVLAVFNFVSPVIALFSLALFSAGVIAMISMDLS